MASWPEHIARQTPRSSYPVFLSLSDSVALQLRWAWCGLVDAFRWPFVLSTVVGDSEVRANCYKSVLLNSLSLVSILTFDHIILPFVQGQRRWLYHVGWFYQVLWLLPVVGLSFYLNTSWCSVIAKRTFTLRYGNRAMTQPVSYSGMLTAIATSAYRSIMVLTSAGLSYALGHIPYAGPVMRFLFVCWIDSYYCFEFVWVARGMSLATRVRFLEERWAYFLAFGVPSSAIASFGSSLASLASFALFFPAYVIMAVHAQPMPLDPYNPVVPKDGGSEVRYPSPFIPIRLRIFAVVMQLNDWIVKLFSVGGASVAGRNRAFSDSNDRVEDGGSSHSRHQYEASKGRGYRVNLRRSKLD